MNMTEASEVMRYTDINDFARIISYAPTISIKSIRCQNFSCFFDFYVTLLLGKEYVSFELSIAALESAIKGVSVSSNVNVFMLSLASGLTALFDLLGFILEQQELLAMKQRTI